LLETLETAVAKGLHKLPEVSAARNSHEALVNAHFALSPISDYLFPPARFLNALFLPFLNFHHGKKAFHELKRGVFVDEVGFIDHPTIDMSGASPDGLVDKNGLVEIKCPESKTHMEYLMSGKPPAKYIPQMMWQMSCTGREWCDFVSFDPRFPENLQILVVKVEYDPTYVRMLELEITQFLDEVSKKVEILRKYNV
jgi:hypothetical protein